MKNNHSLLKLSIFLVASAYNVNLFAIEGTAPPEEAIKACEGKAESSVCNFETKTEKEISGTCHKGSGENQPLACVPALTNLKGSK